MKPGSARGNVGGALAIMVSVGLISILHGVTSTHSAVLHQIFQRLYYIPVVVAGVVYGMRAGLATALFATLLHVPHLVTTWGGRPMLELDKFADVLLFNLVAVMTGLLADRLRAERNRYRRASLDLEAANLALLARTNERLQADRLITLGRLASGIAHEVRNPLGTLLGCLEILERASGVSLSELQFVAIARKEIDRVNRVVADFLEFARPPSAARSSNDLVELVRSSVRLARSNLACRGVGIELVAPHVPVPVRVDAEQLQRAIVNVLLDQFAPATVGIVRVSIVSTDRIAQTRIEVPGVEDVPRLVGELFEPFPELGNGHGLSLATARRLIENQGGSVRAEADGETLRYVIDLPLTDAGADSALAPAAGLPRGEDGAGA